MSLFTFVGVDIAKEKFDVVLLNGSKSYHQIFNNNPAGFKAFYSWLKKYTKSAWVCMEATGCYGEPLADYLFAQAIRVSVVNPLQIKNFARALLARNKNDRIDARIIAEYCKCMEPRLFMPRSVEQKEIRELVQLIDTLKSQLTQLTNQLGSTQSQRGKKALKTAIKALEKQIKQLENELNTLMKEDKMLMARVNLLMSIKGIGHLSASYILAYLPDLNLFENAKQFAAFIGVTPRQCQSGKMKGKTSMTHFGHARLKKVLYMPALVAKKYNQDLKPFVTRLKKNGLSPKAIVGAIMRKLAHLIFGILKTQQPFNAQLACAC